MKVHGIDTGKRRKLKASLILLALPKHSEPFVTNLHSNVSVSHTPHRRLPKNKMRKTETRYKLRGSHPEFESENCRPGDEFTLGLAKGGIYPLTKVGMKKTLKLSKTMFLMLQEKKYLEKYEYVILLPRNEDIIAAEGVKIRGSTFDRSPNGGMVDFDVPEGCNAVILMGNKGGGYSPLSYLLPHQVYVNDLREMAEEDGWEVFYILPVMNDAFPIAYKGDYGKQRWSKK